MKTIIMPLCLLAFLFAFPAQTFAATFVVTTFTDPDNTQGACAAGGACTLRQAINTANAVAGDDTINFAAGLSGQTILLTPALGQLIISTNITIDALAVTNVSVSGGGATRVFDVPAASAVVVMTGFRITSGNGSGEDGGAIKNIGNLTLNNMIVQANTTALFGGGISTAGIGNRLTINGGSILDNSAGGSSGGGIVGFDNSIINLTNVTVSGNTAARGIGGIGAFGGTLNITGGFVTGNTAIGSPGGGLNTSNTTVTVTNASITNNHADGAQGVGGGMAISGGSSTITNSTVSGNTARLGGGGILFGDGAHSITGTTLSGNRAGSGPAAAGSFVVGGGGLAYSSSSGTVNISNSTVSGNSSGCGCGGGGIAAFNRSTTTLRNVTIANNIATAGSGGGITLVADGFTPGTVNIGNTIVADNTAVTDADVHGEIVSQGFNLVRNRGASIFYVASDLPDGSNPMLGALANNGGPTQTHRLLAGSAAIDRGSNALAVNPSNNATLTTDQRGAGFPRIIDADGNGTATVDIGSFEVQLAPTAASVSVSGRVITSQGRGIRNVVVTMTDSNGYVRTTTTTSFGYYRFEEVAAGETYIFAARGKRFFFAQNAQVLSITDDINNINFVANGESIRQQLSTDHNRTNKSRERQKLAADGNL